MGLMEEGMQQRNKMALSAITSNSTIEAQSSSSSPPSTSAAITTQELDTFSPLSSTTIITPRKKRNFDIAFLTGQSETSDEAISSSSITASPNNNNNNGNRIEKIKCFTKKEEGRKDELDEEDEIQENSYPQSFTAINYTVSEGNSNICTITTNQSNGPLASAAIRSNNSSSSSITDIVNNERRNSVELGPTNAAGDKSPGGYQLFETFSSTNNNDFSSGRSNLWKEYNKKVEDIKSHKGRNNNNNNVSSRKTKNYKSSSSSVVEIHLNSKKPTKLNNSIQSADATISSQLQLHQQKQQQQLKKELSPELQSSIHHRGQTINSNNNSSRLIELDSHSQLSFPQSMLPSAAFPFLPQIGRFPIHLTSFGLNNSNSNNSHHQQQSPPNNNTSPISPPPFVPTLTINEKLSKEHHQRLISAYHQQHQQLHLHQQQQQHNKVNLGGFSPEALIGPYSPYTNYPSAAAALLLSQDLNRSSAITNHFGGGGMISPNSNSSSSPSSPPHQSSLNGISISTCSNGIPISSPSAINTLAAAGGGNSVVTTTLLPPSLTSLTLPAQNVCAKCNIGFRMTSDLVYHMRSHHKREADPLKKKREDKLKCNVCLETFRERHHLTRHMTAHQDRAEEMLIDEPKQ